MDKATPGPGAAVPLGLVSLAAVPFDAPIPRSPAHVWGDVKTGLDFIAHNLPRAHRVLTRLNPYPKPWETVEIAAHDGARLAGCYGPGKPGGPAILFAPGTFQTKDDTTRKRRAIDLWRRFGAHVLILDLRGFGGSHAHLGTAGYLESRDLHVAADWLTARAGVERVILWGESLGGASALLAGTLPGAPARFERIVAWSPYSDLLDATRIACADHPRGRSLAGYTYRFLMRVRTRRELKDFDEYLASQCASLSMEREAFIRAGSPIFHVSSLKVPAYVYHAENDRIVPVEHAYALARLDDAPLLHVEIVPRGDHLDFDRAAPKWYRAVTEAHIPKAPQGGPR